MEAAILCLESWFVGNGGLSRAYDFFIQKVGRWPWKTLLSKACIIPKHRFALWLFAHGKFLTRDRLVFLEDKLCHLCNGEDEYVLHLFFRCPVSKRIWDGIRQWLGMRKIMGSPNAVLKAFRTVYRGNSTLARMRCMSICACVSCVER